MIDWLAWHRQYDDPDSPLSQRLRLVQGHLRGLIDRADPSRPVTLVSACAGDGRDVIGVASTLPTDRLHARLIEQDPQLAARGAAAAQSLPHVEVVHGDAAQTSSYAGAVPADIVMLCGVFGNISDDDIGQTIREARHLCAAHATVIWTRHRREPNVIDLINNSFADNGFEPVAFDSPDDNWIGVGVHRLVAEPLPYQAGVTMFTMTGNGN